MAIDSYRNLNFKRKFPFLTGKTQIHYYLVYKMCTVMGFYYFKVVSNTKMQAFEDLLANQFPKHLFYTILQILFNVQSSHCGIIFLAHVVRVLFSLLAPF